MYIFLLTQTLFSVPKPFQEEAIQSIGKGCTGLLYLNLSYCYVTDSIIRLLTK